MKRLTAVVLTAFALFALSCGGSSGSSDSDVTITFSPVNGATDQALDVAVTAIFSGAITEPSAAGWLTIFTLKAGGAGDTLCSAISYDSSTKTATCTHADLSRSTSYTISVSGLTDADSKTIATASASFTTTAAEASTVQSMTKTSNASITDGSGEVTLTFTFEAAVPASTTPTVTVAEASPNIAKSVVSKAVSAGACAFNDGRTACTSTITGLNGCRSFKDYTVTVAGGNVTEYTAAFNSADDEFNTDGTIAPNFGDSGYCWGWNQDSEDPKGEASHSLTDDGRLKILLTVVGGEINQEAFINKTIGSSDLALSVYLVSNDYRTEEGISNDEGFIVNISSEVTDGTFHVKNAHSAGEGAGRNRWEVVVTDQTDKDGIAYPAGDLAGTAGTKAPFYVCIVRYNDRLSTYVSFDGEAYIPLTDGNTAFTKDDDFTGDLASVLDGTAAGDVTELTDLSLAAVNYGDTSRNYYAEIEYARFKSSGLSGTADDCPAM